MTNKKDTAINDNLVTTMETNSVDGNQKKRRSWFDCLHLIIALAVPVTIITYTIIENNNNLMIAMENRQQDLIIADNWRRQDAKIANETRLNNIAIADDQQKETILVQYLNFLVNHLAKYGMELNRSLTARPLLRIKTLAALQQLNSKRKTFIVRTLYESGLINKSPPDGLALTSADLIELDLGFAKRESREKNSFICLYLRHTMLTQSSFRYLILSGADFQRAQMDNSDFSDSIAYPVGECS